jgi:hypothetical protein
LPWHRGGQGQGCEQAAALALAEDQDEMRAVIGQALADYFNGGPYGGFGPGDFEWDENDFDVL